ncbi:hypothetical protein [Kushneria aurantia]|uniref:DNA (cytosine-5-)-methyltransferase n=1 Tax=Kushneria aurantia TaxID=504092 RepID=A0ABV6G4F0_9GAMM|nr:hypothetical protein [Kushneria aurantia]
MIESRDIRHFHLFCGLGGGAAGFNRGHARVGTMEARFRCIGGIDSDPAAIADFGKLTGTPGTVLDLFDRDQYTAFHGAEPPADWREATPADIQAAAGNERPHIGWHPGDNYVKKTCLWSGNGFVMPPEYPFVGDEIPDDRIHKCAPGDERGNIRSATPPGFARAVFAANGEQREAA